MLDWLEFVWKIINSEDASKVYYSVFILMQISIVYGAIIFGRNMVVLQKRKEKSMNEAEHIIDSILMDYFRHYLKKAKDIHGDTEFLYSLETENYKNLIYRWKPEIMAVIRHKVRRNGFEDKKSNEWQNYVDSSIEEILDYLTEYLDRTYARNATIPRVDIYNHNLEADREAEKKLKEMFQIFKTISGQHKIMRLFGWKLVID